MYEGPLSENDERSINLLSCANSKLILRQNLLKHDQQQLLPFWPERLRCAPNPFVRSSLFSVRNKNKQRQQFHEIDLVTIGTHQITYSGEELRQDDLDVYMQIMHYCRSQTVCRSEKLPTCTFFQKKLCTDLKWPTTGFYYKKIDSTLTRLQQTLLRIKTKKYHKNVSLLRKTQKTLTYKATYDIWLEPEIVDLYKRTETTGLNHIKHQLLSPLAKWLNAYLSSHAKPYPILVITVMNTTGCNYSRLRDFNLQLKRALKELKNLKLIKSFVIKNGTLEVER